MTCLIPSAALTTAGPIKRLPPGYLATRLRGYLDTHKRPYGGLVRRDLTWFRVGYGLSGWALSIELDPERNKARVCTFEFTESVSLHCAAIREPVCAKSGTLTIRKVPTTDDELRDLSYRLDIQLGDLHIVAER